jgi:sugar phosphate isomerase/epimerase
LCVSSLLWRRRSIAEIARSMMRLGLRNLDLAAAPVAPLHYQPGCSNASLFNHLAEAGVGVMMLRLTGLDHAEKVAAIDDAGRRGIPAVVDCVERLNFPDLVDRLHTYSMCCARAGVQLIIDNDVSTSCSSAAAQMELLHVIRHGALGFAIAPPHTLADDLDPADEVRSLGNTLKLAYLWDASSRSRNSVRPMPPPLLEENQTLFGDLGLGSPEDQAPGGSGGRLDWQRYFAALAEIRFGGLFNLNWTGAEAWETDQVEQTLGQAIRFCSRAAAQFGFA